jgi:DNA (cytosine-5)-methyltransferase 1
MPRQQQQPSFKFIDMFNGWGGFHLGCSKNGGVCIAACEINEGARSTYLDNFGLNPHDDVRTMVPPKGKVDLVCAGFPCQSHSSLGLRRGMSDPRGQLFYALLKFLRCARPTSFLLENVKGLTNISGGRVLRGILRSLETLGYNVQHSILNSKNFEQPQHRERLFLVGHRHLHFDFSTLQKCRSKRIRCIGDILDPVKEVMRVFDDQRLKTFFGRDDLFESGPHHTKAGFVLRAKKSNFTNRKLFSTSGLLGTICTASPPPIFDERIKMPRHLTKRELLKCQGFPTSFKLPVCSRSTVVKYIGNAVSVNVVSAIVKEMRRQHLTP